VKTEIDFTLTTEVDAPRAEVWAFISDVERLPEWFSEFESVRQESPGPAGLGTVIRYTVSPGSRSERFEIVEWEPGSRLSWDGPPLRWMGGATRPRGTFEVADAGDGRTRFTGRFRPELSGAQVLLRPYLKRWARRERIASLQKLKELVEEERGT
jgi:uncharacterized protein YndB with AHSA1/START domain